MSTQELRIEHDPAADDIQYLEDRLYEYNSRVTGITDGELLAILVRDDAGKIIAGIAGNTWGGCCEIRQLWVDESLRGRGLGTSLLTAVEEEARQRECQQIIVTTHSFQAPGFYSKHGFEVLFSVPDQPFGHAHLFMRKTLC